MTQLRLLRALVRAMYDPRAPWVLRLLWPLVSPFWRAFGCKSVKAMLAECGVADRLGGALTYLYGDYGAPPASAPWFLHSLLDNHWEGEALWQ